MRTLLKELRETLGISQRQLAAFIGGDRTQLVRAENGERNLSDAASLQLVSLVPSYTIAKTYDAPTNIDDNTRQYSRQHAAVCRHKAESARRLLEPMQQQYQQAARLQLFVRNLQVQKSGQLTARQTRWAEQRSYEAAKRMDQCHTGKQLLLQLKIDALLAEAAIYESQENR